jgi:small ligand-binding sensory domain FIST
MPQQPFSTAAHFGGDWDEDVFSTWLVSVRAQLPSPYVSLALLFTTPRYFDHAQRILELIREHTEAQVVTGSSTTGLVCAGHEFETGGGIVLHLFALPGAGFAPIRFTQADVEERQDPRLWRDQVYVGRGDSTGMLAFVDPFSMDAEGWMHQWNLAWPGTPIGGGLASGDLRNRRTQLYLNNRVHEDGGVAVALSGRAALRVIVAQGCTPVGETWTVTRARNQTIEQIGNRPAFDVFRETFASLTPEEQRQSGGSLLAGIVANSYSEEYRRGDFLVRPVIAADPERGGLAIASTPKAGQALRFQIRDPAGATEDLETVLGSASATIERRIYGACLTTCSGRGSSLFHVAHHDASRVQRFFGPSMPLSGLFAGGEFGPVARRNHIHVFSASLTLIVET